MRKILITGASDGIGKAIVKELENDQETKLYLFGRTQAKMDAINQQNILKKYVFDLNDREKLYAALKDINDEGGVDILINNAGANLGKEKVLDIDIERLEKMFSLNVTAQLICIQEVSKKMLEKGEGQIVNVLSSCCKFANPTTGAYTASKCAMEALSKILVKEVKDQGIKVMDVYPGGVDTNFRSNERPDYLRPQTIARHIVYAINNNEDGMIQEVICRPMCENNY